MDISSMPLITLRPEQIAEINAAVDRAVAMFIKKIPNLIHAQLSNNVAEIMGFKLDGWKGTWEIDHCNSRQNSISNFIDKKARESVETAMLTKLNINIADDPKAITAVQKEFDTSVQRLFKEKIKLAADEAAEAQLAKIIAQINLQLNLPQTKAPLLMQELRGEID